MATNSSPAAALHGPLHKLILSPDSKPSNNEASHNGSTVIQLDSSVAPINTSVILISPTTRLSQVALRKLKQYISSNNIENHLFLFAAASLSNLLCYELYKDFGKNQYMDIGSSLGPHLQLEGWKAMRTYLKTYWSNPQNPALQEVDLWS